MKNFVKDSWKEKIDPDYDVIVRGVLDLMRQLEREVENSYFFSARSDILPTLMNRQDGPLPQLPYDGKELEKLLGIDRDTLCDDMMKYLERLGSLDLRKRKREIERNKRYLISLTRGFSERSKKFYMDKFDSLFKGTLLQPIPKESTKEERDEIIRDNSEIISSLLVPLMCRRLLPEMHKLMNSYETEDDIDLVDDAPFISGILAGINNLFSQMVNWSTIDELLANGDNESLLKAVVIDKNLRNHPLVVQRLEVARLTGDSAFINSLGKAIDKDPLKHRKKYHEIYIVLRLFWRGGVSLLKREELYYFLISCGLNPQDSDALRKYIWRMNQAPHA